MHFSVYVAIPPGYRGDIEEYVERAMAPFDENGGPQAWVADEDEEEGGYWTNEQSFWDWYQIGGRWTGALDPSYHPERDERNWERCDFCSGTGVRAASGLRDGKPWCNACSSYHTEHGLPLGWRVKWPTSWADPTGNIARLGDVRRLVEENPPYFLLAEGVVRAEVRNPDWDGQWGEGHPPYLIDNREEVIKAIVEMSDDVTIVVVDCHA